MKLAIRAGGAAVAAIAFSLVVAHAAQASSVTVTIPANAASGVAAVSVTSGEQVTVSASGSAGYGYEGASPCVGYPTTHPDGSRYLGTYSCGPKLDPNAALSGQAIGLLIARIGSGPWFQVGASDSFTAPASGTLVLAYNDDIYSDNTGSYTATVTVSPSSTTTTTYGGGGGGGCGPTRAAIICHQ
jgi:hypothetical protein